MNQPNKTCACCGVCKPRTDYYASATRRDGLQSYCKPCASAKALQSKRKKRVSKPKRLGVKQLLKVERAARRAIRQDHHAVLAEGVLRAVKRYRMKGKQK
jgi:hypothetical protein